MSVHTPDSLESGWAKTLKEELPMKAYRIVNREDSRSFAEYLSQSGLQRMVELIEASRIAIDKLIDLLGRASIEAVVQLLARGVVGKKQRGRKKESIRWYGNQAGIVRLSDHRLRIRRPRLREQGLGAWDAMSRLGRLWRSMPTAGSAISCAGAGPKGRSKTRSPARKNQRWPN